MKRALALSLVLNVALATVAAYKYQHPRGAQRGVVPSPTQTPHAREAVHLSAQPGPITNRFHWRMIESTNYEEYVANLRAAGCPEKTVRDILVAELQKTYNAKCAAVPLAVSFWSSGPERRASMRRQEQRRKELKAEAQAMLQHLLGLDFVVEPEEPPEDLLKVAILRFAMGPLPEEAAEKITQTLNQALLSEMELRESANGILLRSEKEQLSKLHQQLLADVQRLLSPAQYDEFARRFAAATLVDLHFRNFDVSAGELRHIAGLYLAVFEVPLQAFTSSGKDEEDHSAAQKEAFEQSLRDFLGQSRFSEYKRENDQDFQNIKAWTEQQALSPEISVKIYDIKSLFDSERQLLQQDSALPASELAYQLQQAQSSTRSAIEQLLGKKAFDLYLGQNGSWVTNHIRP